MVTFPKEGFVRSKNAQGRLGFSLLKGNVCFFLESILWGEENEHFPLSSPSNKII